MKKLYLNNFQLILGVGLIFAGLATLVFFNKPERYMGFAFITIAVLYYASSAYLKKIDSGNREFKSRAREELIKHHMDPD